MAEFCRQCSIELFGRDHGDLAGITSRRDYQKGLAEVVICEGCGVIQVDPNGNCISNDCIKNHGRK
jgi:hypothetical protein